MVTLKVIAQHCGVSAATVSKALNGAPDINRETALRVRRTAAQLGYLPNATARALKTRRSLNLGAVIEDESGCGLDHEFQAKLVNSFTKRAAQLGYDVTFLSGRLDGEEMGLTKHARYRGCDGVVVLATASSEGLRELVASGLPAVVVDHQWEGCGSVCSDNAKGAADLVRYAYEMGHRRLAFIHGEDMALTRRRIEGFQAACEELGLDIPEGYLEEAVYRDPVSTAAATRRLMERDDSPDCILFPDDAAYLGGRDELERMGLSVPGDVSVLGYDGADVSQALRPRLTTLWQDTKRMGECAAEELVRIVNGGGNYRPQHHLIPGALVPGDTVSRRTQRQRARLA